MVRNLEATSGSGEILKVARGSAEQARERIMAEQAADLTKAEGRLGKASAHRLCTGAAWIL